MTTPSSRVGTTFGKYRITRLLGRGGMGEVYEAYDSSKDRTVALKILLSHYSADANFRTRFQRESRAAAVLQEPHVIPIHDWGEIDGSLYIDMRLIEGATLQDLLSQGALAPQRAVALLSQVAAALDAAHTHGLIHRDVKPQNIIVTPADFVYLLDFGIAQMTGDTSLTATGTQIGSVSYMAPERYGNQELTGAVDVYALTCVLYEALTGRAPFTTTTLQQTITAHLSSPPPRPSTVDPRLPAALDEVIAHGMAKEPQNRYRTAGALCDAARWALRPPQPAPYPGATVAGPMPMPAPAPPQPGSSRGLAYGALGAAVLALAVAAGAYLLPTHTDSAPADHAAVATVGPFSRQQIDTAKNTICAATELSRVAVQNNTNLQNPTPGDPIGDLAVVANARLSLSQSAQYVRAQLAKEPATAADLAKAANEYADTVDELAMNYLAGRTAEELNPLRNQLRATLDDLESLCR